MSLAKPAWPILQLEDPLSVGLVAGYPFYEGSGTILNDLSGTRFNGTFTGGPSWAGGESGSAVSFNGSTQYINTNSTKLILQDSSFSIAALFRATNLSGEHSICSQWGATNQSVLFETSGSNIFFVVRNGFNGTVTVQFTSTKSLTAGQWYRVVVTEQAGVAATIYINGLFDSSVTGNVKMPGAAVDTYIIGADNASATSKFFNGDIAEVRIYNRALTPSEVALDYFDPFSIYRPKRRVPWFTQSGTGAQNLSPSLLTNTSTFFAPTVSPGAVALTPALFTNPNTFFSPTIGRGAVALAPSLFTNNGIFYSPAVTVAGPQALAPSLFTNESIFYLPVVRSRIVLTNVWVELLDTHEFSNVVYPKKTVLGGPSGLPVPDDFAYTPLMQGFSTESQAAIAQAKIDVWGRFDSHGNLLDNPPIPRPIYDPQPTPPVGSKHMLPLGNEC